MRSLPLFSARRPGAAPAVVALCLVCALSQSAGAAMESAFGFPREVARSGDANTPGSSLPALSAANDTGGSWEPALQRTHRYLGYATLLAGVATAASSSSHGFHEAGAFAASGLALLAVVTGIAGYGAYIDLGQGFTTYNVHALLGVIGSVGFTAATAFAESDEEHGGMGGGATVAIGLSIFTIRWGG